MARVWWEGFDEQSPSMGTIYNDASIASFPAGRFGGNCARMDDNNRGLVKPLAAQDRYSMGFAFRTSSYGALAAVPGVANFAYGTLSRSGATYHGGVGVGTNGELILYRAGSTVAFTSPVNTILLNVWYYITFGMIVSDTVGAMFARVDGELIADLTNIDTKNGTGANIEMALISRNNNLNLGNRDYDDWYIEDTYDTNLPERRVETLFPSADGGTLNWVPSTGTSHFGVVDEVPFSTTDYLQGSLAGDKDLLGLTNLGGTPGTIDGIKVLGYAAKTDVATRAINLGVKSGGTEANGSDHNLSSTASLHPQFYMTDPATGSAWTKAAVDALEIYPRVAV